MFEVLPIDDMECVVVINRKEFCISQCDLKKIKDTSYYSDIYLHMLILFMLICVIII